MLSIPQQLVDAAESTEAARPLLLLDIWHDRGPRGLLTTRSDWRAVGGPYTANDVNVTALSVNGAMTLADSTTLVGANATSPSPVVLNNKLRTTAHVLAFWHVTGNNWFGHKNVHDSFSKYIDTQVNEVSIPVTNHATHKVNEVRLRASKNGNLANKACYVYFADQNGKQVGTRRTFTPTPTATTFSITGFGAILRRGVRYSLVVGHTPWGPQNLPNPFFVPRTNYTFGVNIYDCLIPAGKWTLTTRGTRGIAIGGWDGFAASGSFSRVIDVGETPQLNGTVALNDVVRGASRVDKTTMTIKAWYSDTGTTGPWKLLGSVVDGKLLPPHRYWKFDVTMASNALRDDTPELHEIRLSFRNKPLTIATELDIRNGDRKALAGLSSVSSMSSQLSARAASAMVGEMRAVVEDIPEFRALLADRLTLKGVDCRIRAGYIGVYSSVASEGEVMWPTSFTAPWTPLYDAQLVKEIPITYDLYTGIISDVKYGRGFFTVVMKSALTLADVSFPQATSAGLPTGAQWMAGTNLADVAKDILQNYANIRTSLIDIASIDNVAATHPTRTLTSNVTVVKPMKASDATGELAQLLESQWIERQGKLAMLPEPSLADPSVAHIGPDDVGMDVQWSYGWEHLKNAVVTFTGYSGASSNNTELYSQGYGHVDATSSNQLDGQIYMDTMYDKWGLSQAAINALNASHVTRYKQGRQVVSFTSGFRLVAVEAGDRVSFSSQQVPTGGFEAVVVRKDIDWSKQTLKFTLMEVF